MPTAFTLSPACFSDTFKKLKLTNSLLIGREFSDPTVHLSETLKLEYERLIQFAEKYNWDFSEDFRYYLVNKLSTIILTDKEQNIEWVSSGFTKMTGYTPDEAMGRKPSFLQGSETNINTKSIIKNQLSNLKIFNGTLINYRKTGEKYICKVKIHPIFDNKGSHTHFIAFEHEITI